MYGRCETVNVQPHLIDRNDRTIVLFDLLVNSIDSHTVLLEVLQGNGVP